VQHIHNRTRKVVVANIDRTYAICVPCRRRAVPPRCRNVEFGATHSRLNASLMHMHMQCEGPMVFLNVH